jgi:Bacterial SH3 domain/zinc-ribbon domain
VPRTQRPQRACPECGKRITQTARFCPSCGAKAEPQASDRSSASDEGSNETNRAAASSEDALPTSSADPKDEASRAARSNGTPDDATAPQGVVKLPTADDDPSPKPTLTDSSVEAVTDQTTPGEKEGELAVGASPEASSSLAAKFSAAARRFDARRRVAAIRQRPWIAAGAAGLGVLVLILVIVLVAGSGGGGSSKPTAEEKRARVTALRKRLGAPFTSVMQARDKFFAQEAQFVTFIKSAQGKLSSYASALDQYNNTSQQLAAANNAAYQICIANGGFYCSSGYSAPTPPIVSDVAGEVQQLRQEATLTQQLQAELGSAKVPSELNVVATQLQSAVGALAGEANHDADILTEAVVEPNPAQSISGSVDAQRATEIRTDDALPPIGQMNVAALNTIKLLKLDITQYDIAGGHDTNPNDHSQLLQPGSSTTSTTATNSPSTPGNPPIPIPRRPTRGPGGSYAATTDLIIRSGPSTGNAALATIPYGTYVIVQCTSPGETINGPYGADAHWDRVSYGGATGFVSDEYVDTKSDIDNPSIIPPC